MHKSNKFSNPFYVLLVSVGMLFFVTATAYGVMSFEAVEASRGITGTPGEHPLLSWMRVHGDNALLVELALLAVCTFGAIGTDDYWQRRAQRRVKDSPPKESSG